jgi:DNA-binding MarR family transcriptional regulator
MPTDTVNMFMVEPEGSTMQTPDPDSHLSYVIAKVSHQLGITIDRALSEQGITLTQFSALAHIARSPGLSNAELARSLLTTPQATTTLVRRLTDAGLVQRPPAGPGLASAIRLTPRGVRKLTTAEKVATSAEEAALSSLSAAERRVLARVLESLSAAL